MHALGEEVTRETFGGEVTRQQQAAGNMHQAAGSKQKAVGSRQHTAAGTSSRQQATGNRQQAASSSGVPFGRPIAGKQNSAEMDASVKGGSAVSEKKKCV